MKFIKFLAFVMLFGSVNVFAQADKKDTVYDVVDVHAEFLNGGLPEFRKMFMFFFDSDLVDEMEHLSAEEKKIRLEKIRKKKRVEKIMLKAEAVFVVEIDGTISNIETLGENKSLNNEAKKAIEKVNLESKWSPAQIDGYPVRSRFRFPITMNFE